MLVKTWQSKLSASRILKLQLFKYSCINLGCGVFFHWRNHILKIRNMSSYCLFIKNSKRWQGIHLLEMVRICILSRNSQKLVLSFYWIPWHFFDPSPSEIKFWKNPTHPFFFPQTSRIPAPLSIPLAVSGQGAGGAAHTPIPVQGRDKGWWQLCSATATASQLEEAHPALRTDRLKRDATPPRLPPLFPPASPCRAFGTSTRLPAHRSTCCAMAGLEPGAEVSSGKGTKRSQECFGDALVQLYWAIKQGCKQQQSHQRVWVIKANRLPRGAVQQHSNDLLQSTSWRVCTWCSHHPRKIRAARSIQANKITLYCFSLWRIPISVSHDSSVKTKPPVQNKMTESRGKLLLAKKNVISRQAETPILKPEPSQQRKYLKGRKNPTLHTGTSTVPG